MFIENVKKSFEFNGLKKFSEKAHDEGVHCEFF
jgi:hypothetical protein